MLKELPNEIIYKVFDYLSFKDIWFLWINYLYRDKYILKKKLKQIQNNNYTEYIDIIYKLKKSQELHIIISHIILSKFHFSHFSYIFSSVFNKNYNFMTQLLKNKKLLTIPLNKTNDTILHDIMKYNYDKFYFSEILADFVLNNVDIMINTQQYKCISKYDNKYKYITAFDLFIHNQIHKIPLDKQLNILHQYKDYNPESYIYLNKYLKKYYKYEIRGINKKNISFKTLLQKNTTFKIEI